MKKKLLLVAFWLQLVAPLSMSAQNAPSANVCGMSVEDSRNVYNRMMELRERYPNPLPMRAVVYVPVWFHLVAQSDGTGRVSMAKVLDMLCAWNQLYSNNALPFQFYIKGINNIDNSSLYSGPRSFAGNTISNTNKKADGMNVFLLDNANDPSQPNATVLGYYLPSSDWLVIVNSQVSTGAATTIAHEAGHFFSLPHPFLGWEACPFTATSSVPCAPATVSCNGGAVYTVENAARTGTDANCSTAGDGFCDTPPDYNLGFGATSCTYTGLACDPKGIKIDPDEKNLMGYFSGCESTFSTQQKAAMQNDYSNNFNRAYIRAGNIAPSVTNLGTPTLTTPANNATSQYMNNINLIWNPVSGATGYVVEISKLSSFLDIRTFVTTNNALNINNSLIPNYFVAPGTRIYWRVKAFNNYVPCAVTSASQSFVTGTLNAVNEIEGVSGFEISPNPLSKTEALRLNLTTEKPLDATVKLYNVAGKLMKSENVYFNTGFSSQNLSVSDLSNGLYILTIESENGILNKKVIIQ